MKILYIADGRSQIALNWIKYIIRSGHEVYLVSTFPCQQIDGLSWLVEIPVALSGFANQKAGEGDKNGDSLRSLLPVKLRTLIRQLVAPLSFTEAANKLEKVIEDIQPDVVHAMRIPYEGMIASIALDHITKKRGKESAPPLLISVWGNDFTLHAQSTGEMSNFTRQALSVASGLHTDCQRDMRLAAKYGFDLDKPYTVLPGAGGVQLDIFHPVDHQTDDNGSKAPGKIGKVTVINPRGFRAYVRNDTFFRAIPLVLEKYTNIRFICPDMQGEAQAEKWSGQAKMHGKVELLPEQSRQQMAELFQKSQITVSITTHDGTPNTLLEAMACGCFPIAGDIESLHEWIAPGVNGLLIDPGNAKALAEAILQAIVQPELRKQAKDKNLQLVSTRADYRLVMQEAAAFYHRLVKTKPGSF